MKRNIVKVLFLSTLLIFPAYRSVQGQETRKYDFKDFSKVEVSHGMHVKITQSDNYSIEVKASERDFKHLEVDKDGQTLEFTMDHFYNHRQDDIYINITMPKLAALNLSGGSMGQIAMSSGSDNFSSHLSGGSKLKGKIDCGRISIGLSGGSWVGLTGTGGNMKIDGSGGSIFKLKDLAVKNVDAELSGGSQAEINMNGKLNTDQSGGSKITYYGNAVMGDTDFSGGSSVTSGQ